MSISMAMPRFSGSDYAAICMVVLLHALGLWALMQYAPARAAMSKATTLMVSLVKPETPPEPPRIIPPKPRPQPVKPKLQPIPLAVQTPLPSPVKEVYVPPPEPQPEPVAIDAPPLLPSPLLPSPPAPVAAPPLLPVTPPETSAGYADNPLPQYPAISRRLGEEGRLQVRVCVRVDGTVSSATVSKSSGFERLDRATVEALRQWRFKPAHRGDEPVPGCVAVPWNWSLNN